MNSPVNVAADNRKPMARRTVTPRVAETTRGRRPNNFLTFFLVGLALIVGAGVGAVLTRRHYKAQAVVASINGRIITAPEFYSHLEEAAGENVLRQMLSDELRLQYAAKLGVSPTEAQVNAKLAELSKQPGFTASLAQRGQTLDSARQRVRVTLAEANVIDKGISVSEADMRKFYEKNVDKRNPNALFYTPETIQIAAIVTTDKARADEALHALVNGLPFARAAKTYSQDNSKANGGLLPPIQRGRTRSHMVPGMEQAIFALKINEQMGPRQFAGAWWIIRCLDKKPEVLRPYDQVKEDCRQGASLTKGLPAHRRSIEADYVDFRKKANVQAFWQRYQNAVNDSRQ